MRTLCFAIITALTLSVCAQNHSDMNQVDTTPVKDFEIERYLGTWYEIGRNPHTFEKNLTGVTATYTKKENGMIEVRNAGYKYSLDGKYKTARGKAKFGSDPGTGHLKVSFFLFFYGDYFILKLDKKNYQWALVGGPTPDYLWVLSKTPSIPETLYEDLLREARERGYSLEEFSKVPQPVK